MITGALRGDRTAVRARPPTVIRADVPAARSSCASSIEQFWFIASVTILPTALVSIPFGAVIALQVGSLDPAARRAVVHRRAPACSPSSSRPARSSSRC